MAVKPPVTTTCTGQVQIGVRTCRRDSLATCSFVDLIVCGLSAAADSHWQRHSIVDCLLIFVGVLTFGGVITWISTSNGRCSCVPHRPFSVGGS